MLSDADKIYYMFFFSSRRRHTRCALVTGVQTCALPIFIWPMRIERQLKLLRRYCADTERDGVALDRDPLVRLRIAELYSGVELLTLHAKESYAKSTGLGWHADHPVSPVMNIGWHQDFSHTFCQPYMDIIDTQATLAEGPAPPGDRQIKT